MQANILKGKIVESGMTVGEFCEKAGFVRSTFDRKLNGKSVFNRDEIQKIIDTLGLSWEDAQKIFFAD